MNQLKNKKLIAAVAVFLILAVVGGVFLWSRQGSSSERPSDEITESDLPTLTPEDIGMEVTIRPDNKALMFDLTKASDIELVEYTIEYEKEVEGETANEGIFGIMEIGKDGRTDTNYREFGTCSAGKCRYDNVTSDITINLKVTKKDGKEYQVQKIVKL